MARSCNTRPEQTVASPALSQSRKLKHGNCDGLFDRQCRSGRILIQIFSEMLLLFVCGHCRTMSVEGFVFAYVLCACFLACLLSLNCFSRVRIFVSFQVAQICFLPLPSPPQPYPPPPHPQPPPLCRDDVACYFLCTVQQGNIFCSVIKLC